MFRFKFKAVLNYRKQAEETCRQDFAGSKQAWVKERKALETYHVRWRECIDEWRRLQSESLSIWEISLYQKYMLRLKHEITQQSQRVRECLQEMDKKREKLLSARKDLKMMEKLQEQDLIQYRSDRSQKEKKFLDEVATQRFNLKGYRK